MWWLFSCGVVGGFGWWFVEVFGFTFCWVFIVNTGCWCWLVYVCLMWVLYGGCVNLFGLVWLLGLVVVIVWWVCCLLLFVGCLCYISG